MNCWNFRLRFPFVQSWLSIFYDSTCCNYWWLIIGIFSPRLLKYYAHLYTHCEKTWVCHTDTPKMKMMTKETVVLLSVLTLRNFDSMLLVSVGKKNLWTLQKWCFRDSSDLIPPCNTAVFVCSEDVRCQPLHGPGHCTWLGPAAAGCWRRTHLGGGTCSSRGLHHLHRHRYPAVQEVSEEHMQNVGVSLLSSVSL